MANKEVVTVLTVKTEQSQNTIKGLKAEIADLKKKLDTAVIGTDEFERASKELATAQANLKTVLADGKKTTDAVEGSYNHLVATMAELKKQWKATADEVKRNELGQQIDSINSKLKDMDASTGNFQRNVGDYANQFKEAFEEQQKSTQNVRLGLDGLQKTAAGLASGYAAVQGVMNLLNIENSNFEKAMIKVQSAMAIAQGVGGMKDLIEGAGTLKVMFNGAITSVKGFIAGLSGVKKAIAATGIGLLVVALGTLIAYWDEVTEFMGISNKAAEEAAKKQKAAAEEAAKNAENWRNKVSNAADTIISKYSLLVAQYKKLETESQKQQWIKDNADAFNDLGLSITNVQDAENSFINNTGKVVDALIKRATAMAKQEQLTELAGKYMDARLRAEETYRKNKVSAGDKVYGVSHTVEGGYEEVARHGSNSGNWVYTVKGAAKKNQEIWNSAIQEAENIFVEMNNLSESLAGDIENGIISTNSGKSTTGTSTDVDAAEERAKAIAEAARKATIDTKEEELAELERIYKQEKKLLENHKLNTANLTKQYGREQEEIKKKYAEKDKADAEKTLSIQEKNIDRWADLERRKLEEQQKVREDWNAENEVDLDGNSDGWYTPEELEKYQTFLDTKQSMYAESISAENMLIQSQIEKLQELANAQAAAGMDNTGTLQSIEDLKFQIEDNNAAILDNEKETLRAKAKANEEYAKQQKAQEKMLADYKLNIASSVLGSLATILGEESAAGKAAAVAQATIDTYMAANAAYSAMAGIPVVGPALGAAAAAAAVLAGVANVKKILSVKAGDKDSSSSNVSATAAVNPSINLGETMPIQYTRELLTDSETTNLNKEQRVYVLESDISNTQENVKVKESNSSF